MAKTSRKFKGIWIPAKLWLAKDLSIFEKAMLAEIDSLSVEDGCFASNEYLSAFFSISLRRVQQVIARLEEKGLVFRHLVRKNSEKGGDRKLSLSADFFAKYGDEGMKEISPLPVKEISPQGCKKFHPGHERNFTPGVKEISPLLYKEDNKVDNKDYNKDDNKKNLSADLSKAASLLRRLGVQSTLLNRVIETYPPQQIIAAVKNGLAKEKAEAGFSLQAGYVLTALSRSAREGRKIKDTAAARKLRNQIASINKKFTPKNEDQIAETKKAAMLALGVG